MRIFRKIQENIRKQKRKTIIRILCSSNPESLLQLSEREVLKTLRRAYAKVPGYARLLKNLNIDVPSIKTIKDFKAQIPYLDKQSVFQNNKISELCIGGTLTDVKSLLTSSGHSGIFSFGVNTYRNLKDSSESIDLGLDYSFNISGRKTLLINCLPMGVKVNTSLTIAETSIREDMVWAVIKKFSSLFEQTILVGEGSFLKKIIEEGTTQGISWKSGIFHLVTGEEGIAENYRSYIATILGTDFTNPAKGMIGSSMGIAELDLNIFHETKNTIAIRRAAHADPQLRCALFGKETRVCPMLFVYYPHRTYIEELPNNTTNLNEIVISMLSQRMKIPLIRYKTGDSGKILPYRSVVATLSQCGYEKLIPELKLPLIAIYGRGQHITTDLGTLYPEEIKEHLYSDFEVAASITGAFKLTLEGAKVKIAVQLRKNIPSTHSLAERIQTALGSFTHEPTDITIYPYSEFPYFMEVDYERKFNYI